MEKTIPANTWLLCASRDGLLNKLSFFVPWLVHSTLSSWQEPLPATPKQVTSGAPPQISVAAKFESVQVRWT